MVKWKNLPDQLRGSATEKAELKSKAMVKGYVLASKEANIHVQFAPKGHPVTGRKTLCKKRAIQGVDANVDAPILAELDYSLITLGKLLGPYEWRMGNTSIAIYGFDKQDELVAVLAGKIPGKDCELERIEK